MWSLITVRCLCVLLNQCWGDRNSEAVLDTRERLQHDWSGRGCPVMAWISPFPLGGPFCTRIFLILRHCCFKVSCTSVRLVFILQILSMLKPSEPGEGGGGVAARHPSIVPGPSYSTEFLQLKKVGSLEQWKQMMRERLSYLLSYWVPSHPPPPILLHSS